MAELLGNYTASTGLGAGLVEEARKLLGIQYSWGDESRAQGFDCSGLTWYVAKKKGYTIPRTAAQQWSWFKDQGKTISLDQAHAGDLVYFAATPGGRVTHTGVYLGDGMMIDAPHTGAKVREESIAGRNVVGFGRLTDAAGTTATAAGGVGSSVFPALPEGWATGAMLGAIALVLMLGGFVAIAAPGAEFKAGLISQLGGTDDSET